MTVQRLETDTRPGTEIRSRSWLETDSTEGTGPDTGEQMLQLRERKEETSGKNKDCE